MEKTCPSCYSCGMPLVNASDYALGDVNQQYCSHCTDTQGQLKPYEVVLSDTAKYLAHSQGLAMTAAMGIAKEMIDGLPAWREKEVNMSKKIDLYSFIHKAQRVHLFNLAIKIGLADFSNEAEVDSIDLELRDIIARLKAHSIHEDTLIHPLFRELGDQIAVIDEEHDELGEELLKLEHILDHKQWDQLYPELNRFISSYLAHQDEEETMQEHILWKHFDNARLGTVMTAFQASRSPAQKMDDLKFIIPGLNVAELTAIFQGIKASAPAPAFEAACQIAQMHLEPSRWAALHKAISPIST